MNNLVDFSQWDTDETGMSKFYVSILIDDTDYVDILIVKILPYYMDDVDNINAIAYSGKDEKYKLSYKKNEFNKKYNVIDDGESIEVLIYISNKYPTIDDIRTSIGYITNGLDVIKDELIDRGYDVNSALKITDIALSVFIDKVKRYPIYENSNYDNTFWQKTINGKKVKITVHDVQKYLKNSPVQNIPVDYVRDILINDLDKNRVKNSDLKYPIIVTKERNGQYGMILDGNHRLMKAIQNGHKYIKAKILYLDRCPSVYKDMFKTHTDDNNLF